MEVVRKIRMMKRIRRWLSTRRVEPSRLNDSLKIEVFYDKLPNAVVHFEAIYFCEGRFDNGKIETGREASMIGGYQVL